MPNCKCSSVETENFQEHISVVMSQEADQKCLGCICEAVSGCDTSSKCEGDKCGPYRISPAYWADAGKPTVNGESPDGATAYTNCVSDKSCAGSAVKAYMAKYKKDCNGDGVIDCDDFILIHLFGGDACTEHKLPGAVESRYEKCMKG
ncbi:unnamed protein product [Callosobruchus maculatus]|uniref:lysozyme n=1 Tax=Callosobruchus maculatus TaxID=64391 RepID=A0A653DD15_CALMS|nr:unnamed protein product [Callosobruchus maculatus]